MNERELLARHLGDRGLRVTSQRLAVLGAIRAQRGHPNVAAVLRGVRRRLGGISTQAVYNILNDLAAVGLVRRIEPAGSPALYEGRVEDNHHHLVCRGCGAVTDIACVVGHAPCLTPSATQGYIVDEAEVTFWGLCGGCRKAGRRRSRRLHRAPSGGLTTSRVRRKVRIDLE